MATRKLGLLALTALLLTGTGNAVSQNSKDNPSISAPYPKAGDKAPGGGPASFPSNIGANTAAKARDCDIDALVRDAENCFDANRPGYSDLFEGSCNKSRDKTEAGFFACQAQNETARNNFSSCSPDQQIDVVRAAGRNRHAYGNLFACGF